MSESHWIENEQNRKRFWAEAGNLGLGREQVHAALGVEHVEQYGGSLDDALAACREWRDEALRRYAALDAVVELGSAARAANPGDAIGRLSWKVAGPSGASYLLTASIAGLSPQAIREMHREIRAHLDVIEAGYPGHGYALLSDGRDQPAQARTPTPHAAQVRAAGGEEAVKRELEKAREIVRGIVMDTVMDTDAEEPAEQPAKPARKATAAGPTMTFPLEAARVATTGNGKRYYACRGGQWQKYGATAWPEVFEAVFAAADWPVGSEHEIEPGMSVTCLVTDKGYPGKVISIA